MTSRTFDEFFRAALGEKFAPFDYQRRLACGEKDNRREEEWLRSGTELKSRLINIPTGLGKTVAIVSAWLWNQLRYG
jgi:CRISPR-associated endonuclease/helicase Cas3